MNLEFESVAEIMCSSTNIFLFFSFVNFVTSTHLFHKNADHVRKQTEYIQGTVNNPNITPGYDCALRAFTIEMAGYIQPYSSKSNWTTLSENAFQMNECVNQSYRTYESSKIRKHFQAQQSPRTNYCFESVFVDSAIGNDTSNGTFDYPLKTIVVALSLTRQIRSMHDENVTICIILRGGTYYLGANISSNISQLGAIALTNNDSNLIIENYQNEQVVLSGGILLNLHWSIYKTLSNGGTIMKSSVPSEVNLDEFNELYIDNRRAIIAKYPNGDPSTQGLYAKQPGFAFDAELWWPSDFNRSQEVHINEPYRNGTYFSHYQIGLNGGASVFNPPVNFWSTEHPPAGDNYKVPRGVTVKSSALPNMRNWTKPTTGLVHAFHAGYWGSWVFEIASTRPMERTILFGRGGFQEARGNEKGGAYYVANIFEELDSPNEWFLDKDTRTLYFMPNETMPKTFVASQIPCLISLIGTNSNTPVNNIFIRGLTLTQTSHTYLNDYMVPSGGDWSVHRGGTILLRNTTNITITENLFTEIGSNGIAVIDYNQDTSITLNEFVWLADSAVIIVGTTNGIDGFTVTSQPNNILIQSNIIHETGIYVKQSAPVLIAVSRSVSVVGNLMFNIPRAAVNINDGFYGNHTISWNVMFNTVRETSDHGPINTWDRQPFSSDGRQTGVPSLWQHPSYIHHNLLFNNYNSFYPIDHDDGSCFYEDSYNFQVYGGKKNYLGHSKTDHHEIYVYPDTKSSQGIGVCVADQAPQRGSSGWNETWINNTCILYSSSIPYNIWYCEIDDLFVPYLADNQIYVPSDKNVQFQCKVHGISKNLSLDEWQSYGLDLGTIVQATPNIETIIQWGRNMFRY